MAFSVTTDNVAVIHKLIADQIESSQAARFAVRRVGNKWKANGCDLPEKDADLIIPLGPEEA